MEGVLNERGRCETPLKKKKKKKCVQQILATSKKDTAF